MGWEGNQVFVGEQPAFICLGGDLKETPGGLCSLSLAPRTIYLEDSFPELTPGRTQPVRLPAFPCIPRRAPGRWAAGNSQSRGLVPARCPGPEMLVARPRWMHDEQQLCGLNSSAPQNHPRELSSREWRPAGGTLWSLPGTQLCPPVHCCLDCICAMVEVSSIQDHDPQGLTHLPSGPLWNKFAANAQSRPTIPICSEWKCHSDARAKLLNIVSDAQR